MEQYPVSTPNSGMSKSYWAYFTLTVALSAIITGSLVYFVQNKQNTDATNTLQAQIDSLKSQVAILPTAIPIATATSTAPATVSPSASPTVPKDLTAGWIIYHNADSGIGFKYPKDWLTTDLFNNSGEHSIVTLISPATSSALQKQTAGAIADFKVTYFTSAASLPDNHNQPTNAKSLSDYIQKNTSESNGPIFSETTVNIGSYSGYRVNVGDEGGSKYTYIEHNGRVFRFKVSTNELNNQILDTLSFD